MKLLGISCGRKLGNSEILLKEALIAAEQRGIEVELLRLADYDFKACTGCEGCVRKMQQGKPAECVLKKDDMPFLAEKLDCEGLIVAAPVYFLGPPGILKVLNDRLLPWELSFKEESGTDREGAKKRRVGGLISVAGNKHSWGVMGLPLMNCFTFPQQVTVVDQMLVTMAPRPGQVLLDDDAMGRARRLGEHVAEAMALPDHQVEYKGPPGLCPICHSDLLYVGQRYPIECPICATGGTLVEKDGKFTFVVDERSLGENRFSMDGRGFHFLEIHECHKHFEKHQDYVRQRLQKYISYKPGRSRRTALDDEDFGPAPGPFRPMAREKV